MIYKVTSYIQGDALGSVRYVLEDNIDYIKDQFIEEDGTEEDTKIYMKSSSGLDHIENITKIEQVPVGKRSKDAWY